VTGSAHIGRSCSECSDKDKVLAGVRWDCAQCPGVSLCSQCYGMDKHNLTHEFVRYDWPASKG
jgi:hypothetical protein